ncbi:MAG: TIM barrel protein [Gemmatales bacterium]|nr:TIM barrel protein [Gemmatales bacterium]
MQFIYFTKSLQNLDTAGVITFLQKAGLQGADLTVRPGYPVTPDNAESELPRVVRQFREAGLSVPLVTAPTHLTDANSIEARRIFAACQKAGVGMVKIGYFLFRGHWEQELNQAKKALEAFSKLADHTKVRACYHTHSGNYLGNNAANLRWLLSDCDPHYIGAFLDTGHLAINGGPFRYEVALVRSWFCLLAIKDMLWKKDGKRGWQAEVVPAGQGLVRWSDVAAALKDVRYNGVISLHAEYEAPDLSARLESARQELTFLRQTLLNTQ